MEDAAAYREHLIALNAQIGEFVRGGRAVLAADMFTFDGSLAKGRKTVSNLSKLMLRAYNAETDNCVRSLRSGDISTAKKRLENAMKSIEKLGVIMEMRPDPDYHQTRVVAGEGRQNCCWRTRGQARRDRCRHRGQRLQVCEHSCRLHLRPLERGRPGNVGALGPNIVKIGITRRLEPPDRVRELGDATPFLYDTHALFFSDDAITLENQLHKAFAHRRVNCVNERREFFFATPTEVRDVLAQKVGGLLEFTDEPEAAEYFQSRGRWPALPG